jgi:hypothetical protein
VAVAGCTMTVVMFLLHKFKIEIGIAVDARCCKNRLARFLRTFEVISNVSIVTIDD